jgi:hypothetical protein
MNDVAGWRNRFVYKRSNVADLQNDFVGLKNDFAGLRNDLVS